jgi:hypothetical protein
LGFNSAWVSGKREREREREAERNKKLLPLLHVQGKKKKNNAA